MCGALSAQRLDIDSLFARHLADGQLADSTDEQRCAYRFAEGVRLRLSGKFDEALGCFGACIRICGGAEAYYEMSRIYQMNQDSMYSQLALLYLYKAIERDPDNAGYQEALVAWCLTNRLYGGAINGYNRLLQLEPNNERYMYALVDLYQNQPKKQLEMLRRLERLNGVSKDNSYQQMSILLARRRYGEVEKQIRKLMKKFPYETAYKALLGDLYLDWGKESKALECYGQMLAADSLDGNALISLASYYGTKGDVARANECMLKSLYDKRIPFDDRNFWLRPYLVSLAQDSATEQIDSLFGRLFALYPDEEQVWQLRVDYLLSYGGKVDVEQPLRRILALNPQNEDAWKRLLQTRDSVDAEALEVIDGALAQFPNSPYWHYCRMGALLSFGRDTDALAEIDAAVALDMDNTMKSVFYATKGDAVQRTGHYAQAAECYEIALRLDAANTLAKNNYAYLLACSGRNLSQAEKMSSAAVKAEPENATYLDTYAWVLFMRGDYRLARFYQERALALVESSDVPVNAEFYEHYGDILSLLGDADAAVEQWRKALQTGGSSTLAEKIETRRYIPNPIEFDDDETK